MRRAAAYALDRLGARGGLRRAADRPPRPARRQRARRRTSPTRTNPIWPRRAGSPAPAANRKATPLLLRRSRQRRIAEIVRANLAEIGIDVRIDASLGCLTGPETRRLAAADMQLVSHLDALPIPRRSSSSRSATATRRPATGVTRACEAQIERARATRGDARHAATRGSRGRVVRDAMPMTVYASCVDPEFFSARVGCKVSQGALNIVDLGALCLRADQPPVAIVHVYRVSCSRGARPPGRAPRCTSERRRAGLRAAHAATSRDPRPPARRQPDDGDAGDCDAATSPSGPVREHRLDVDAHELLDGDRRRRQQPARVGGVAAARDADEPELRGRAGGEPRTEFGGRPVVIAPGEQDGDPAPRGQRRRSGEQRDIAGRPLEQECQLLGNRSLSASSAAHRPPARRRRASSARRAMSGPKARETKRRGAGGDARRSQARRAAHVSPRRRRRATLRSRRPA